MFEVVDVLVNIIAMGDFFIIYNISNYHTIYFKYLTILIFNYTSKRLKKEKIAVEK